MFYIAPKRRHYGFIYEFLKWANRHPRDAHYNDKFNFSTKTQMATSPLNADDAPV